MSFQKILIINIFGIGDVLFTTPLIRSLKEKFPEVFIGYIVNPRAAGAIKDNPLIDKIILFERDDLRRISARSKIELMKTIFGLLRSIRNERYDLVIDLSLNSNASFLMWLIGIPQRIGYNYKNRSPWLTQKIPLRGYEGQHVAEFYLDILKFIHVEERFYRLEMPLKSEDEQWAKTFLSQSGWDKKQMKIALVPGGGASWGKDAAFKRWPEEKWAELADKIIENLNAEVILMGDLSEQELCRRVQVRMNKEAKTACGQTSLGQFAALLKQCDLAVMNDGGPLHVAVASGVRTVSIFGPVDSDVYGPYPKEGHAVVTASVACRPCYRRFRRAQCDHVSCLKNIQVEDVFEAVKRFT